MNETDRDPTDSPAVVVDADEFNRQQRFQEIHDARQRVISHLSTFDDKHSRFEGGDGSRVYNVQLSTFVSVYITELLPLLEKRGGPDPYMAAEFPDESQIEDLKHFSEELGLFGQEQYKDAEIAVSVRTSMKVFQIANRAFAELGMELDVAEENADASFDYSDILQNGAGGDTPDMVADGGEQ